MSSNYAKKMAQLSARIFGQLPFDKNTPNGRLIQRLAQKPINQIDEYSMNYYPRHQENDHLFKVLRHHGLYRDEHRDFIEEIERLKRLRGKGKRERKIQTEETKK
ncbi:unnamed protein product [Brachionus calyciflorus]|uniref:Small ribosomal subunit protein mS33 n=1 Tax=Brachionus calyciflorus TaxID=104777 RepID=A0A813Q0Q3_9BILA|nr:unnamed protein product [Brachionus calyciflorus]